MTEGYGNITEFIKQIKIKKSEGILDILYGIKIDKYFVPSGANVIGTVIFQIAYNRMYVGRDYSFSTRKSN